jgi:hypothetical protein
MRRLLLLGVLLLTLTMPGMAQNIATLPNFACVQWMMTGVCMCGPTTPCVVVSYWEPAWLIETVKQPGSTNLGFLGELLHAVVSSLGMPSLGGGGAANASGSGQTNLQYNETHVFTYPQFWGGPCTGCSAGNTSITLHYASEVDPRWRTATAPQTPVALVPPLGVWAPLFPRGGKAIHSSEPVGSAIAATRGLHIAVMPVGPPPHLDRHVVLQRAQGMSTCCQLATPTQTGCFLVGTPPVLWEHGTVSPRGTYTWIFWRQRSCCVPPDQTTCGITLRGGYGANTCLNTGF